MSSRVSLELHISADYVRRDPFGHDFAELAVNGCVRDHGFHHNEQSLNVLMMIKQEGLCYGKATSLWGLPGAI